jgi:hypothetical protein
MVTIIYTGKPRNAVNLGKQRSQFYIYIKDRKAKVSLILT